ncbi:MAG: four helix bundle protein [Bacteroidales bacterium]
MAEKGIKSLNDLEVYRLSYSLSVEIQYLTLTFPKEEMYSLTSQIRRSSRSVAANISEGFAKRFHENLLRQHLLVALGSLAETKTWLEFARDFSYISEEKFDEFFEKYDLVGAKLFRLFSTWNSI